MGNNTIYSRLLSARARTAQQPSGIRRTFTQPLRHHSCRLLGFAKSYLCRFDPWRTDRIPTQYDISKPKTRVRTILRVANFFDKIFAHFFLVCFWCRSNLWRNRFNGTIPSAMITPGLTLLYVVPVGSLFVLSKRD